MPNPFQPFLKGFNMTPVWHVKTASELQKLRRAQTTYVASQSRHLIESSPPQDGGLYFTYTLLLYVLTTLLCNQRPFSAFKAYSNRRVSANHPRHQHNSQSLSKTCIQFGSLCLAGLVLPNAFCSVLRLWTEFYGVILSVLLIWVLCYSLSSELFLLTIWQLISTHVGCSC